MKLKLLLFASLTLILFTRCNKASVNPIFDSDYKVGSYLTLKSTDNVNFDFSDLSKFVGITVGQFGSSVSKVNVFVVDDASSNNTWTLVKSFDFTGDSIQLHVTGNEIANALGYTSADFLPGNTLTFYNQVVTADGTTYDLNNAGANASAPDLNSVFSWTAYIVCPFIAADAAGTYEVVEDDWADYSPGDLITVSADAATNQISFLGYPSTAAGGQNQKNTVVDVDPATGEATIASQETGDYSGTSAAVSGSGFVFSCTGVITLTITVDYGGTPYAGQKFVLQKQ